MKSKMYLYYSKNICLVTMWTKHLDLSFDTWFVLQDPVLFSGTLRKNLDPFVEYKDADIREALEEVKF